MFYEGNVVPVIVHFIVDSLLIACHIILFIFV